MPGGDPDPGVVASFLAAVAALGWSNNHLVEPLTGAARYPAVVASRTFTHGQWAVESSGDSLSEATYDLLRAGTANTDGSFTDASGARYTLRAVLGVATPIQAV